VGRAEHLWIPARADYAIRALVALAGSAKPLTADAIARERAIPKTYLTVILAQLRRAGLVRSRRGRTGGYSLEKDPAEISLAEVLRAVDETVDRPIDLTDTGLNQTYQVLRGSLVGLLDTVSVAELLAGTVPDQIRELSTHVNGNKPVKRTRRRLSPRGR
jgi:Rrf2 family protein